MERRSRQHVVTTRTATLADIPVPASGGKTTTATGTRRNPVPRGRTGYLVQKTKFFELLAGKEKELFDELFRLGREEASYAARYFCINGEPEKTHGELVKEGTFPSIGVEGWAIVCASAILRYLDPAFPVSKHTAMHAQNIRSWVLKHRDVAADSQERQRRYEDVLTKIQAVGISQLPKAMPERYYNFYLELARAWDKNKFAELKQHARLASIIGTRWGFEDGCFYTLEEIADVEQITRERVRQIEQKALKLLGVIAKPSET